MVTEHMRLNHYFDGQGMPHLAVRLLQNDPNCAATSRIKGGANVLQKDYIPCPNVPTDQKGTLGSMSMRSFERVAP